MIVIEDTIVSENLLDRYFVCNLSKCKGACCIEGDQGAPLLEEELDLIQNNLEPVFAYLPAEQQERIREAGFSTVYPDGELGTQMMDDGACVFVVRENGILSCGIEKAYKDGKSTFQKPVSCHLYPVRVKKYKEFSSVNYDSWSICSAACTLGRELEVPLYLFVEEALVRRFGKEWMKALKATAEHLNEEKTKSE